MAMLLDSIATSGVRRSDGTPAASGFVFLYMPGTTTLVAGYRDNALSQTWPTTNGGIQLDASGRAAIWVVQKVDVVINDASGAVVATLLGYNGIPAPVVEIQNAGFTGAITDPATGSVTQGPGGLTDLNTVLSSLAASTNGPDGQYKESAGATPRPVYKVLREIHVTPQDFGAAGNGSADDTAAILAAITELGRLGTGALYLPPGSYKYSAQLQVGLNSSNALGLSIIGAGSGASILKGSAGLQVFLTRARLQGFSFSGGGGLDIENSNNVIVEDVGTDATAVNPCKVGSSSEVMLRACKFAAVDSNAASIGLWISYSTGVRAIGNQIIGGSSGLGCYIIGPNTSGGHVIDGNTFSNCGLAGIAFQGDVGGGGTIVTGVSLVNNHSLGSLATPILPLATVYQGNGVIHPYDFTQIGNNVDGYTANLTTGGSHTPLAFSKGPYIKLVGTTTGSAYLIAAPDWAPLFTRGREITIEFVNAAGGAVTGWTLASGFILDAVAGAIPTTDLHSIQVKWAYDLTANKWRELSRSNTLT